MLFVLLTIWWVVVCVLNLKQAADYGYTQRMATLLLFSTIILSVIVVAMR
jgi:hypothetical protein